MSPMVKPFNAKDRLADYVDVKARIGMFLEAHPDGRLVTSKVWTSTEPDGVPRVWVRAKAYRTPDDPRPGVGHSYMILPGSTPYTRGSEVENAETSAWGRAIGALGIGIEKSIATTDEIESKDGEADRPAPLPRAKREPEPRPDMERTDEPEAVTLTGTVAAGKSSPSDMLLRTGPDGSIFGFVLMGESFGRTQVVAEGLLADDIWDAIGHDGGKLFAKEVTVTGRMERVAWQNREGREMPPYKLVRLDSLRTPDWTLPDAPVEAENVPMFGEPVA